MSKFESININIWHREFIFGFKNLGSFFKLRLLSFYKYKILLVHNLLYTPNTNPGISIFTEKSHLKR